MLMLVHGGGLKEGMADERVNIIPPCIMEENQHITRQYEFN